MSYVIKIKAISKRDTPCRKTFTNFLHRPPGMPWAVFCRITSCLIHSEWLSARQTRRTVRTDKTRDTDISSGGQTYPGFLLWTTTQWSAAGEAHSGQDALRLIGTQHWDLLVLDIGLPDLNGIEVLKRIKQACPDLPVLIFSMHAEDDCAVAAQEAGAAG